MNCGAIMKKTLAILTFTILFLNSGCSSSKSEPEIASGWKSQIDQYVVNAKTDKQREILSDYWVSDEELIEIHNDWLQCMAEHGFLNAQIIGEMDERQGYMSGENLELGQQIKEGKITEEDYRDYLDETMDYCEGITWRYISMFYWDMRDNPEMIDPMPDILECLKAAGEVPDSASLDDYYDSQTDGFYNPSKAEVYCKSAKVEWSLEGLQAAMEQAE